MSYPPAQILKRTPKQLGSYSSHAVYVCGSEFAIALNTQLALFHISNAVLTGDPSRKLFPLKLDLKCCSQLQSSLPGKKDVPVAVCKTFQSPHSVKVRALYADGSVYDGEWNSSVRMGAAKAKEPPVHQGCPRGQGTMIPPQPRGMSMRVVGYQGEFAPNGDKHG